VDGRNKSGHDELRGSAFDSSCPRLSRASTPFFALSACHARLYAGHPRLYGPAKLKGVDGRDEPGHDVDTHCLSTVMPAHSRPKDGVLSHAYVAGIHVLASTSLLAADEVTHMAGAKNAP